MSILALRQEQSVIFPPPAIEESELVSLIIVWVVLFALVLNRYRLAAVIPAFRVFFLSFFLSFLASIFTNIESFYLAEFFNLAEHLCYAGSMVLFVAWLLLFFKSRRSAT